MATKSIKADYSKSFLFPPALEDWVPADHPARFVREVVEALDLVSLGFEGGGEQWGGRGRPHYSGRLLLKAWLYGYMNRIRSQRQLERACRENVGLIWLLGMEQPDARMMPCEGAKKLAYNAQAVVDGDSGLIVAGEVVNEAVDCRRLGPMLEEAEANLGGTAGDTVADPPRKLSSGK